MANPHVVGFPTSPSQQNWEALQVARPRMVTAIPSTGVEDQVILFQAAAGVVWQFRYRANSGSSYPWEFIGGGSLFAHVAANQTTASGVYADLATAGPDITLPLAGEYDVEIGCGASNNTLAQESFMSYAIGATPAADADLCKWYAPDASNKRVSIMSMRRKTIAPVLLRAKYRVGGGTGSFEDRWMRVSPLRVG
jgi:hypothetical protein